MNDVDADKPSFDAPPVRCMICKGRLEKKTGVWKHIVLPPQMHFPEPRKDDLRALRDWVASL